MATRKPNPAMLAALQQAKAKAMSGMPPSGAPMGGMPPAPGGMPPGMKRGGRVKRYDGEDGSVTSSDQDEMSGVDDAVAANSARSQSSDDSSDDSSSSTPSTPTSFGAAFKAARTSGDKTFTYNGKSYTTQLAGDSKPAAKPAAKASTASYSNEGANKPRQLKQETMADRAESYVAKRAAARAADSAAASAKADTASETDRLRQRHMPASRFSPNQVDRNTLLPKKMASGGSASSRGDGIASKGKTRGKYC